jgi:integrase
VEKKSRRERQRSLSVLRRFAGWLHDAYGVKPSALVVKARRGGRGPEKVERVLREYSRFLMDSEGQKESSAIQWYSVLRGFFTANDASLGRYPDFRVQSGLDETAAVTQDRVKRMVKSCDNPLDKFLIAFLAQSGQRIGVLTAMRRNMIVGGASVHGIVNVPEQFQDPQGENVNTLERQYTFIVGRHTMQFLHDLDEWQSQKHSSYQEGWLFNLSKRTMGRIIDNAAQAVHIQEKEHTKTRRWLSAIHPNAFREFYKETMIKAGSDPRCFVYMMGNRVPTVLGSSEPPAHDKLLEAYRKAEPKLGVL